MAEAEPKQPQKRRLRAPAQSVRQKSEQAQSDANKPQKKRHVRAAGRKAGTPFRKLGRVFNRQPFRFIGRILAPRFARNAFKELKLVTWPSARETMRLTFAVLAFAVVFSIIIGVVDYGLDKLFRQLLLK